VKTTSSLLRWTAVTLLVACVASSVSCMTTYDTYGRPVQTVDPGLAVAGVAAAGLIGYAVANNNNDNCNYRGGYYGGGYYRRAYRPCY
jgi:hypothetical protein